MSARTERSVLALALALALPLPAFAGSGGSAVPRGENASPYDLETEKAVLFYQDHLFDSPSGIREHDGWTYFQSRVPMDDAVSGREKARRAAFAGLDRLVLRWMIDQAVAKRGPGTVPHLAPGASLVRELVREVVPEYEFGKIKIPPVDLIQLAEQTDGDSFVVASASKTADLSRAVPGDIGIPWTSERWTAAAKDAIRLRYRNAIDAFLADAGALDLLSVGCNETEGTFPSVEQDDFPDALTSFIRGNGLKDVVGCGESAFREMQEFVDALAHYATSSETARTFRNRAHSLQQSSPVESTAFGTPVTVAETNRVISVETNWIEKAETVSNRFVRTLVAGNSLRGAIPYGGQVFVEREATPAFVVTTNETVTIRYRTEVPAETVRLIETGRPQFERLFLSAGTLPNAASPQTDRGAAAVSLVYKGGVSSARKEAALMDALGENPGDKTLWNFLGRIYQDRQDWIGAAICFRNALRLDPEFDYALTNLADCHKALGNVQLAVGTAVLAKGLATNEWCEKRAAAILETPLESFGGK